MTYEVVFLPEALDDPLNLYDVIADDGGESRILRYTDGTVFRNQCLRIYLMLFQSGLFCQINGLGRSSPRAAEQNVEREHDPVALARQ